MRRRAGAWLGLALLTWTALPLQTTGQAEDPPRLLVRPSPVASDDTVMIPVSREALRKMSTGLGGLRESINSDLKRLERDYLVLRQTGIAQNDPKEKAARAALEDRRTEFNTVVDQFKAVQLLSDKAETAALKIKPPAGR